MGSTSEAVVHHLPILNISALMTPDPEPEALGATLEGLRKACSEWGAFYAVGHGVDPAFISNLKDLAKEFFRKPKEFKRSIAKTKLNFRGFGDTDPSDPTFEWTENFDYTWDDAPGPDDELSEEDGYGRNRWPAGMPEFKEAMKEFYEAQHRICSKVTNAIFATIGMAEEKVSPYFEGSREHCFVQFNYYPVCPDTEAHLGQNPHTDADVITIVMQDDHLSALQVLKDGTYYDVPPVEDSFVINVGEMLQVWSNDVYKTPIHRVLTNKAEERLSSVMFFQPSSNCQVEPLPSCISKDNPVNFETINFSEYLADMHYRNATGTQCPFLVENYRKKVEAVAAVALATEELSALAI